ncbi:hypothetical protein BDV06DRAFT_217470 [Aspergillus oleicola]
MAPLVSHAVFDDVDALNAPLAAVELEGMKEPSRINPFLSHLDSHCYVDDLVRNLIPYQLGKKKYGISEESFQNWKELLCGWLGFPVILLLNPSESDKLGHKQMIQQSPALKWLEENLKVIRLELRDVIVMDMFPMVTDKLLKSKGFAEDASELAADSFELTLTCLRYIQPQELASSEAGAQLELVKTVDVDGYQMLVVQGVHPQNVIQYNEKMEKVLKKLLTRVLGPFGQWKEQQVAEWRESARREVILVKEGVRDGMRALMKQMQLFEHICGQGGRSGMELSVAAKRVEEWRKQMEG